MDNKKKIILGIVVIVITLITITGVTLAVFNYAKEGTKRVQLSTGTISMTYKEGNETLNISNVEPMTDEDGMLSNENVFDFTMEINMRGNQTVSYEVTAEKVNSSTLGNSDVKLYLQRGTTNGNYNEEVLLPTSFNPLTEVDTYGARTSEMIIDSGTENETTTYYYRLRMWVDEDYSDASTSKSFTAKVNVYGKDGEIAKNNKVNIEEVSKKSMTKDETIDLEMPSGSGSITWTSSNTSIATVNTNGVVTPASTGTVEITGVKGAQTKKIEIIVTQEAYKFAYNGTDGSDGSPQEFIVPKTGTYKLEVWGASGGNSYANDDNSFGGYGGYSTGNIILTSNDQLYLYVGGKGSDITVSKSTVNGGYNGGGIGGHLPGTYETIWAAGGGATHISKVNNLLSELEEYKGTLSTNYYISNDIYIVAAGGGASGFYVKQNIKYAGGHGGGYIGVNGSGTPGGFGYGGTQTAGGSRNDRKNSNGTYHGTGESGYFGHGGSATTSAGGGSGFFGGGTGHSEGSGAGGGSSYIANSYLTSKSMYCYGCSEDLTNESTFTVSTTGTSNLRDTSACPNGYSTSPISKCAKLGNGYAKITYLGE